jgi:ABC-type proline/glycine betaine transport system permease subunit
MNHLSTINEKLTKGMVGIFLSIIPLSLLTLLLPVIGYALAITLILLMLVTAATIVTTTILFVQQINQLMENFFKHYEQESAG